MTSLTPNKTASAGLRAFFNIAEAWKLSGAQQMSLLGLDNESTLYKWKKDPDSAKPSKDLIERISYILGIYRDLQTLLPDNASADAWVTNPSSAQLFGGKSPLDRMCHGSIVDLFLVRQYLARERGI